MTFATFGSDGLVANPSQEIPKTTQGQHRKTLMGTSYSKVNTPKRVRGIESPKSPRIKVSESCNPGPFRNIAFPRRPATY